MYRRSFLQKSILGVGAAALSSGSIVGKKILSESVSGRTAYMAECGVLGKDDTFILGFLMVDSPQTHEDQLISLRNQLSYNSKLTYRSNDTYKVDFAKAAIDYFVSSNDMVLVLSREVLPENSGPNNYTKKELNTFKIDFTNSILTRYGGNNSLDGVVSKFHSLNGPSNGFISEFQTGTTIPYESRVTFSSNLLQLSSFLCSSITSIINKKVTQPIKIELNEYLADKLGISDFSIDQETNKVKFYS
ncbi:MAG: hypothetical protein AAGA77_24185 [Bacteroidota bacterium]